MIYVYIIAAVLAAGLGGVADHFVLGNPKYAALQAQYSDYQVKVGQAMATAQTAANAALQDQIAKGNKQDQDNAKTISDLNARSLSAESDRDIANRLLDAARRAVPPASSDPVKPGADQPGAADATKAPEPGPAFNLSRVLTHSVGECSDAVQRLYTLQLQLSNQTVGASP